MTTRIEISVPGEPCGRPRPRSRAMQLPNGKWVARTYQPKRPSAKRGDERSWLKANAWHDAVKVAFWQCGNRPSVPWDGPVSLTIDVYFERPQRLLKKSAPAGPIRHTGKPDRDNLDKAVMDPLKEAGLFVDDCQVCDGPVRKWYVARGTRAGVRIVAEHLVEEEQLAMAVLA